MALPARTRPPLRLLSDEQQAPALLRSNDNVVESEMRSRAGKAQAPESQQAVAESPEPPRYSISLSGVEGNAAQKASTSFHRQSESSSCQLSHASANNVLKNLADAELVALAVRGNRKAYELLYRRYAAFAINLATRLQGSTNDVDDVAHDAFIKAFERLATLREPSCFQSWLGSIVLRQVRSNMRRARLMRLIGLAPQGEQVDLDAIAAPGVSPVVRAQIAQAYALLRTQPVDERIAWILRHVEGHDLRLVAEMTGCSLATVKRRIAKVQRFLDVHFVDSHQATFAYGGESAAGQGDSDSFGKCHEKGVEV